VEPGAVVGDGTLIWPGSVVRRTATIGARCTVGRWVYVDQDVTVGDDCKLQDGARIYGPAVIGRGVFLGPSSVLTNDLHPRAVGPGFGKLRDGEWTRAGVHVEAGASVGAHATVLAGVVIGHWSMIGAGAVVTRHVLPFALVVGNPARQIGWVGRAGQRLTRSGEHGWRCPVIGTRYRQAGERLFEESDDPH
jgi:acetyltransferase-like isoleucine patch superfamily enzyme